MVLTMLGALVLVAYPVMILLDRSKPAPVAPVTPVRTGETAQGVPWVAGKAHRDWWE
jgi:hypothetical protein